MGASRMRQVYKAFARKIETNERPMPYKKQEKEHNDLSYEDNHHTFNMRFLWAPEIPQVQKKLMQHVLPMTNGSKYDTNIYQNKIEEKIITVDFVLIGFGLWSLGKGYWKNPRWNFEKFKQGIPRIIQLLQAIPRSTEVVWMILTELDGARLIGRHKVIKNGMVRRYNQVILEEIRKSSRPIIPWNEFANKANVTGDGMHFNVQSLEFCNMVLLGETCRLRYRNGTGPSYFM